VKLPNHQVISFRYERDPGAWARGWVMYPALAAHAAGVYVFLRVRTYMLTYVICIARV
jgi:hypothetical protein